MAQVPPLCQLLCNILQLTQLAQSSCECQIHRTKEQGTKFEGILHILMNQSVYTCHLVKCLKVLSEIYHYALIFREETDDTPVTPFLQEVPAPSSYSLFYRERLKEESQQTDKAYEKLFKKLSDDETCAMMDFLETSDSDSENKEKSAAHKHLSMVRSMMKLVGARIRISAKKSTLEKMSCIQNAITYLNYIVLTLNAFITGFGL